MSHIRLVGQRGIAVAPRQSRRLSDKILAVFHGACDRGELDIAADLLRCCEAAMNRQPSTGRVRRRDDEALIAAFERLWFLRHPEAGRDQHPDNLAA